MSVWWLTVRLCALSICVVSIIRFYFLYVSATWQDPTYEAAEITIWSSVELNIAITVACLITLKPFVARFVPGLISGRDGQDTTTATGMPGQTGLTSTNPPTISSPRVKRLPSATTREVWETQNLDVERGEGGRDNA